MKSENDKKLTKIEKKTNGPKIDRTELLRTVDRKIATPVQERARERAGPCVRRDGERRGIDKDAYRIFRDVKGQSESTTLATPLETSFSSLSLFFFTYSRRFTLGDV